MCLAVFIKRLWDTSLKGFVYKFWNLRVNKEVSQRRMLIAKHEPRHDKTNKVAVRPAKTQISLGSRLVWSESSLSAWRKLGSLATH